MPPKRLARKIPAIPELSGSCESTSEATSESLSSESDAPTTSTTVSIYTDGSASPNPGVGGAAAIFVKNGKIVKKLTHYGGESTTNNKMELQAILLVYPELSETERVVIYTDSEYVKKGLNEWVIGWEKNNWMKKDGEAVKNVEQWKQLLKYKRAFPLAKLEWVKAHADNQWNNIVDKMAKEAAKNKGKKSSNSTMTVTEKPEKLKQKIKSPSTGAGAEAETKDAKLYILDYSEKSFVVMGNVIKHSDALGKLGGKYTPLKIGTHWMFPKIKKESVEQYIQTGEIKPYKYSEEEIAKFRERDAKKTTDQNDYQRSLIRLFGELKGAFDQSEDYEGSTIINVIEQLQDKYIGK